MIDYTDNLLFGWISDKLKVPYKLLDRIQWAQFQWIQVRLFNYFYLDKEK